MLDARTRERIAHALRSHYRARTDQNRLALLMQLTDTLGPRSPFCRFGREYLRSAMTPAYRSIVGTRTTAEFVDRPELAADFLCSTRSYRQARDSDGKKR
jgi:hypothetical protein